LIFQAFLWLLVGIVVPVLCDLIVGPLFGVYFFAAQAVEPKTEPKISEYGQPFDPCLFPYNDSHRFLRSTRRFAAINIASKRAKDTVPHEMIPKCSPLTVF